MDFSDQIKQFVKQAKGRLPNLTTEEGTKTALILPFIQLLGYNVFDPAEVIPEFTADIGTKKGEKVDYAIIINGKPAILIEAKPYGNELSAHNSQLFRYFAATDAKFAIITDGILYRFFSDLQEPNKMDLQPFFEFNLLNIEDVHINELKRFQKERIDIDDLATAAIELKYTRLLKQMLEEQLREPSDDFIRFWVRNIYPGKVMQRVIEQFRFLVKRALNQYINDLIGLRLKTAMESVEQETNPEPVTPISGADNPAENIITTTEEELEGYYIIKSILRKDIDPSRINYRDHQAYFNIYLDNPRNLICRLRFGKRRLRVDLATNPPQQITIEHLDNLYNYTDQLLTIVHSLQNRENSQDS